MKIVLCGIQEQGKEIVKFLAAHGIEVTHIVTISKEIACKNNSDGTWVSYEDLGLPIYYAKSYSLTNNEDVKFFQEQKFDLLLLGGWQRLISDVVLSTLICGGIGQHGSSEHLPKGRGRSPINWSLIKGKKRMIWNLFELAPGVDDGDVIDHCLFEINDFDDCNTIYYKVETCVKHMLLRTIPKVIDGSTDRIKQIGDPTYFLKRTPEDGKINWGQSLHEVRNLIRGVTKPYPGAFAEHQGVRVRIWKAQAWDSFLDFYREK